LRSVDSKSIIEDSRSIIEDARSILKNSRSIINNFRSIVDNSRSIIDNSRGKIDDSSEGNYSSDITYDRFLGSSIMIVKMFLEQATSKCSKISPS
jgi:hypothetical protein